MGLYFWSGRWYKMTSNSKFWQEDLYLLICFSSSIVYGNYVIISATIWGITIPKGRQPGIEQTCIGHSCNETEEAWTSAMQEHFLDKWQPEIYHCKFGQVAFSEKTCILRHYVRVAIDRKFLKHYKILTRNPFHIYTFSTSVSENVEFFVLVFEKVFLQLSQNEVRSNG